MDNSCFPWAPLMSSDVRASTLQVSDKIQLI